MIRAGIGLGHFRLGRSLIAAELADELAVRRTRPGSRFVSGSGTRSAGIRSHPKGVILAEAEDQALAPLVNSLRQGTPVPCTSCNIKKVGLAPRPLTIATGIEVANGANARCLTAGVS